MRYLLLTAITAGMLLCAPARGLAAEARALTVAVLYFDNNTGDRELDVLKKGFADMMITDLSTVKELMVVERARLQALLDELKLQRTKFFDQRTAIKLGKGLGATHVITGSFVAVKPQIRIDMRMIEVASSRVALAAKVVGEKQQIFDLEQQLVARFTVSLKLQLQPQAFPRTKVPDVSTLVKYSRSIHLADQGRLKQAQRQMARVISAAPSFGLARIRLEEMKKRLASAQVKRQHVIGQRGEQLLRSAEAFINKHKLVDLDEARARHYIGYRVVLGWYLLRALREQLSSPGGVKVIRRGKEAKARGLMITYTKSQRLLVRELQAFAGRFGGKAAGKRYISDNFALPAEDAQRAREAGFTESLRISVRQVERSLAEFLLLGRCSRNSGQSFLAAPPLSFLVPRYRAAGLKLLRGVIAAEDAKLKGNPLASDVTVILSRELYGDALLLAGKKQAAVAKWQEILELYPASSRFKYVERRIKQQLGLVHDYDIKGRARYVGALSSCKDMELRVGWSPMLNLRLRTRGLAAITEQVAEIEKHCQGNPGARRVWSFIYSHAALAGARHGDCKLFDKQMKSFLKAGGSPGDARGYRKNLSKCP